MSGCTKLGACLAKMTWDDMERWSGARSVARGQGYLRDVSGPVEFADGSYVAVVRGRENYYTRLYLRENGELESRCTCPVGGRCKHAVAVALVCAGRLKNFGEIEKADMSQEKWQKAKDALDLEGCLGVRSEGPGQKDVGDEVDVFLNSLDRDGLRLLFDELMLEFVTLRPHLQHRLELKRATTGELVAKARKAIKAASSEPYNKWDDDSFLPDYSPVRECFEHLRKAGDIKSLLALADELKERGESQAEYSDDEDGEIGGEVSKCMDVVERAVMESDMDAVEKVKWERRITAGDEWCLLEHMETSYMDVLKAEPEEWSRIADYLLAEGADKHGKRSAEYVCRALARAGRVDEGVRVWVDLLESHGCYPELVHYLMENGRTKDAEEWCRKGLGPDSFIRGEWECTRLRDELRAIAASDGDMRKAAGFDLDAFLSDPRKDTFDRLRAASSKVHAWPRVRDFILAYLEKGDSVLRNKPWPLPKTNAISPSTERRTFPMTGLLTDIAVAEKRGAAAMRWYKACCASGGDGEHAWYGFSDNRRWAVAEAAGKELPEESLKIFNEIIRENLPNPDYSCYLAIVRALAAMRTVMAQQKRLDEWRTRVDEIRTANKRRRSFVKMLDDMVKKGAGRGLIADGMLG